MSYTDLKVGDKFLANRTEDPGFGWQITAIRSDNDFDLVTSGSRWFGHDGFEYQGHSGAQMEDKGYKLVRATPTPVVTVAKKLKAKKNFKTKPLYLVASRNGMTHKGIANVVNKRGVSTFGNSVTQALSKYEDRFGKKLDLDNALVFKLVPHTIRTDKRNGRARIGRETK